MGKLFVVMAEPLNGGLSSTVILILAGTIVNYIEWTITASGQFNVLPGMLTFR